jgi:hypothetical protein
MPTSPNTCAPSQHGQPQVRAPKEGFLPPISSTARCYTVKELARRAGVGQDFFRKWVIEVSDEQTTVTFGPELNGRISFSHATCRELDKIAHQVIPVSRAGWLHGVHYNTPSPDLILPFCESQLDARVPLYRTTSRGALTCRLDILASVLFTLSRVEETLSDARDEHGRFPAAASLAIRHEFLERPILDEHGLAFQQALLTLFPNWQPQPPAPRYKLTHDIDDIGIPFHLRTTIGHGLKRRKFTAPFRDLLSSRTKVEPAELTKVRKLAQMSASRGLHSAFYWKASARGLHDSGYNPREPKIQRVLNCLREGGFELGVHPGYETFADRPKLAAELNHLRQTLCVDSPGGRQHYLRWSPETWLDWEACDLSYDSSLGYADHFGFRAGTAFPYRPWSFAEDRELKLIEVPLILMDCTPVKYMHLPLHEGLRRIKNLFQRVQRTGGVFTMLWHNTPLLDPDYRDWYESILNLLAGAQTFDVPGQAEGLW